MQSRAACLLKTNFYTCIMLPKQDLVSRISISDKILQMARGGAADNGLCTYHNSISRSMVSNYPPYEDAVVTHEGTRGLSLKTESLAFPFLK